MRHRPAPLRHRARGGGGTPCGARTHDLRIKSPMLPTRARSIGLPIIVVNTGKVCCRRSMDNARCGQICSHWSQEKRPPVLRPPARGLTAHGGRSSHLSTASRKHERGPCHPRRVAGPSRTPQVAMGVSWSSSQMDRAVSCGGAHRGRAASARVDASPLSGAS